MGKINLPELFVGAIVGAIIGHYVSRILYKAENNTNGY